MPESSVIISDGSLDFSGGINSIAVTTVQSDRNPGGIPRNMLCWLDNATVRDGGITPRGGYQPIKTVAESDKYFQGKFLYEPVGQDPYFVYSISGHILLVRIDGSATIDLTEAFPANVPQFNPDGDIEPFFVQAEQFLVIQAGDGVTLPFIWDGMSLRRSIGITNTAVAPGTPGVNEIPAATTMDYFMGRIWYAQDRTVSAGDIVRGPSGTVAYNQADSVLNVTENPMVLGGDGFTVPSNDGSTIRGIKHSANIDAALGQGRLFVGTRKAIYALNVPVTRADWIAATNSNQPLMTVVQLNNGWVNDRSIVAVNGDLFFQSLEPGIRSLNQATRLFTQWGNIPISANENRILQYNDRSLLRYGSGIYFNNRLLQTALPRRTEQGVVNGALIPLDFTPISGFNKQKEPNWEGMQEGVDFFQLAVGDFGGRERAFATIRSREDGSIQLWELTAANRFDKIVGAESNRITWIVETPAYTWGDELNLKKLVSGEIWIDRLFGTVLFSVEYRPDSQACWLPWISWQECSKKNQDDDVQGYLECLESYRSTMVLPQPPAKCTSTGRPSNIGYQFQLRLSIHGFCRVRGVYLHAEKVGRKLYANMVCA